MVISQENRWQGALRGAASSRAPFWRNIAAIAVIALAYLVLSLVLLRKQEA